MSYLAVDDVDARVAKAKKAGGTLMRPIFDVPDVGRIAILMQPDGAGIAWMTPKPKA
jgi:predicted enzyme related to lactoylglutathione lyase